MPFVYYIPEQDTEAMQKPMNAERLLALLGSQRKAGGISLCRLYGGTGEGGPGAHPPYHQTALSGNGSEIPYFPLLR